MTINGDEQTNFQSLINNFDTILIVILIIGSFITGVFVIYNTNIAQDHIVKEKFETNSPYQESLRGYSFFNPKSKNIVQFNLGLNSSSNQYIFVPTYFIGDNQAQLNIFGFEIDYLNNKTIVNANYSINLPIYYKRFQNLNLPNPYFEITNTFAIHINQTNTGLLFTGRNFGRSNFNFILVYSFSKESGFHLESDLIVNNSIGTTNVVFDKKLDHDVVFYSTNTAQNGSINFISQFNTSTSMSPKVIEFVNNSNIDTFNIISYSQENNFTFVYSESFFLQIKTFNNPNANKYYSNFPNWHSSAHFKEFLIYSISKEKKLVGITNDDQVYLYNYSLTNNYIHFIQTISVRDMRQSALDEQTYMTISYNFFTSANGENLEFRVIGLSMYSKIFTNTFTFSDNSYVIDKNTAKTYETGQTLDYTESLTDISGSIYFVDNSVFTKKLFLIAIKFVPVNTSLLEFNKIFELSFSVLTFFLSSLVFIFYRNHYKQAYSHNGYLNFILSINSFKILFSVVIISVGLSWLFKILNINISLYFFTNNLLLVIFSLFYFEIFYNILNHKRKYYVLMEILNSIFLIVFILSNWFDYSINLHINYTNNIREAKFLTAGNLFFGVFFFAILSICSIGFIALFFDLYKNITNQNRNMEISKLIMLSTSALTIFSSFFYVLLVFGFEFLNVNDLNMMTFIYLIGTLALIIMFGSVILNSWKNLKLFTKNLNRLNEKAENNGFIGVIVVTLIIYNIFVLKILIPELGVILGNFVILGTVLYLNLEVIYILFISFVYYVMQKYYLNDQENEFSNYATIHGLSICFLLLISLPLYFIGAFIIFNLILFLQSDNEISDDNFVTKNSNFPSF